MAETKLVPHTPGEWHTIAPARDGKHWRVATRSPNDPQKRSFLIATIDNGAPGDTLHTEAANARLFAAAPDLLAACAAWVEWMDADGDGTERTLEEEGAMFDAMRDAVAKARGTT